MADAEGVIGHFEGYDYGEMITLNDDITIRFTDVGHLLGSASIEIWMREDGIEKGDSSSPEISEISTNL